MSLVPSHAVAIVGATRARRGRRGGVAGSHPGLGPARPEGERGPHVRLWSEAPRSDAAGSHGQPALEWGVPCLSFALSTCRWTKLEPALQQSQAAQLDQLGGSISRFGYVEPIILDDRTGRMVAGHGRRETLLKMRVGRGGAS